MQRFILTLALVAASVLAAAAPGTANAQYGYYGTFSGGGRNLQPHVRSLAPYGGVYQSFQPVYGNGYAPYGYAPYGYGQGGYGPYGRGCNNGYGGNYGGNYGGGYSHGGITIRW